VHKYIRILNTHTHTRTYTSGWKHHTAAKISPYQQSQGFMRLLKSVTLCTYFGPACARKRGVRICFGRLRFSKLELDQDYYCKYWDAHICICIWYIYIYIYIYALFRVLLFRSWNWTRITIVSNGMHIYVCVYDIYIYIYIYVLFRVLFFQSWNWTTILL
jgi:hypothetical protein